MAMAVQGVQQSSAEAAARGRLANRRTDDVATCRAGVWRYAAVHSVCAASEGAGENGRAAVLAAHRSAIVAVLRRRSICAGCGDAAGVRRGSAADELAAGFEDD